MYAIEGPATVSNGSSPGWDSPYFPALDEGFAGPGLVEAMGNEGVCRAGAGEGSWKEGS